MPLSSAYAVVILLAVALNIVFEISIEREPESTTLTILNTSVTGSSIFSPMVLVGASTKYWPTPLWVLRVLALGDPPIVVTLYATFPFPWVIVLVLIFPAVVFVAVYVTATFTALVHLVWITAAPLDTAMDLLSPSVFAKLRYWPLLTAVWVAEEASLLLLVITTRKFSSACESVIGVPDIPNAPLSVGVTVIWPFANVAPVVEYFYVNARLRVFAKGESGNG